MRASGLHLVRAISEGVPCTIDQSEWSHALMRANLDTPSIARFSTASSNFVVCSRVNAEHRQGVGEDLVCTKLPLPQLTANRNGDANKQQMVMYDGHLRTKGQHARGSACQEWFNSKLSTYKRLRFADRRLIQEELEAFRAKCTEKSAQLLDQMVDQWRIIWRAADDEQNNLVLLVALPGREVQSEVIALRGSPGETSLVPVANIVEEYKSLPSKPRHQRALHDPTLEILPPPPQCCATPQPEHKPLVFGCCAKKQKRLSISALGRTQDAHGFLMPAILSLGRLAWECLLAVRTRDRVPMDRASGRRSAGCADHLVGLQVSAKDAVLRTLPLGGVGRCHLEGVSAGDRFVLPKDFPTLLQYNDACFNLSAADLEWKVVRLAWRWPEVAGTFFLMEIAAVGEESTKVEAAPIKKWRKLSKDNDF